MPSVQTRMTLLDLKLLRRTPPPLTLLLNQVLVLDQGQIMTKSALSSAETPPVVSAGSRQSLLQRRILGILGVISG